MLVPHLVCSWLVARGLGEEGSGGERERKESAGSARVGVDLLVSTNMSLLSRDGK